MRREFLTLFLGGALLSPVVSFATEQTNDFTVGAGNIFYYGYTRDLDCSVQLVLAGSLMSNVVAITDARITRAVDDTGKDLKTSAAGFSAADAFARRVPKGWLQILRLKCPDKSAQKIQQLKGEIDLAVPTKENGGRFVVENFMSKPGQVINDARLDKYGIKLTFQTLESYTDFQRAHPKQYVDGMDIEVEKNCFSGIYGSPTNPPRTSVAIQIDDPQKKLIGLSFETADDSDFRNVRTFNFPSYRCFHFDAPLPNGLKLVVFVAAPGVIQTKQFSLKDVELPWTKLPAQQHESPATTR